MWVALKICNQLIFDKDTKAMSEKKRLVFSKNDA